LEDKMSSNLDAHDARALLNAALAEAPDMFDHVKVGSPCSGVVEITRELGGHGNPKRHLKEEVTAYICETSGAKLLYVGDYYTVLTQNLKVSQIRRA
jgi:hypothetical protein